MKKFVVAVPAIFLGLCGYYVWVSRLSWNDFAAFGAHPVSFELPRDDPLARLGVSPGELRGPGSRDAIRYVGKARYLNNARAVVMHTIDDSTEFVPSCLDAMDKYGIKATVFVSTEVEPILRLWPRLREAIANGHEIGSHSRRHQCQWPDSYFFCFRAYTDYEVSGSRDDILKNTRQPYVWSWAYPCGNCADREFAQRKLARAGYLTARAYPGEEQDLHNLPDLKTYDPNPYDARYTQVVQKKGGIARSGRTDVPELNAKFDEVYQRGGIYSFLSHPQWLDFGPTKFYEQHLAYIGHRSDVWYVPMGPLYAYRMVQEKTEVRDLEPKGALARFAVYNRLDPKVFLNSLTLEFRDFRAGVKTVVQSNGKPLVEKTQGATDRWDAEYYRRENQSIFITVRPNTILEFR